MGTSKITKPSKYVTVQLLNMECFLELKEHRKQQK